MNDALIVSLLSAVPKNRTARLMGWSTRLRLPAALHRAVLRWYVRHYGVNVDEAEGSLDDYRTLGEFFVRPLRPGVRPVDPAPDVVVSPVDACVHTIGRVQDGLFVQAPGLSCSVRELLGTAGGIFEPDRYRDGHHVVLYLSPKDYHRVHTPREGQLSGWRYLPGRLWPVFPAATRRVQGLFDRNERLAFLLDTDLGPVAEVLVGAFGVGRISSVHLPVVTNTTRQPAEARLDNPVPLPRAAELGRFEMGSTVILLFPAGRVEWTVSPGADVRLGQPIARSGPGAAT